MTTTPSLPSNIDAEEQVLGSILADGKMPPGLSGVVRPDDFYKAEHRDLFEVLEAMAGRGEPTDVVTVAARFNGSAQLAIRDLAAGAALPDAIMHHAGLVREAADRRRLIQGANSIIATAVDPAADLGQVRARVSELHADTAPTVRSQRRLAPQSFRELSAEVQASGPRTYLVQGVIVAGTHGVEGGAPKGGKGWDALDLAVSVASGTPWLSFFDCPTHGPVLIYAAEEDKHELRRRVDAICRARGIADPLSLPIHIVAAAPHLAIPADRAEMSEDIERLAPVLVILDPLYRAAGGANYRSVFDMGNCSAGLRK